MDFVPEIIDGTVVLNGIDICSTGPDCRPCSEVAVGIHNWLVAHEIRYLIVDFQDEKEVCTTILTELLQLNKRLDFPFIFCGMMEAPKNFMRSYLYNDHPFFEVPEDAVAYLKQSRPELLMVDLSNVREGEVIPCTRSRHYRSDETETEETESDDSSETAEM
ncbi:hypothetical protein [Pseudobacteriovorax antillogorgiicola]|uniref:Uncharacterized protein n=1 Tax=Pseudobacteriovorax antillogorgiicola TaxID=1513793 RepID=A0A1Y6CHK9_9BACT|nr:hypothetical protein [Pseudobacteriovorax antillogorgiicola]TCS48619.1 hypothetical protein EDD56_11741 [Pseudobacteriovorax antillogorgiicola]SMF55451.1 hypothetical protein SAMN06296036_117118 [Pseudobacteriovorax antillogorgiicola]